MCSSVFQGSFTMYNHKSSWNLQMHAHTNEFVHTRVRMYTHTHTNGCVCTGVAAYVGIKFKSQQAKQKSCITSLSLEGLKSRIKTVCPFLFLWQHSCILKLQCAQNELDWRRNINSSADVGVFTPFPLAWTAGLKNRFQVPSKVTGDDRKGFLPSVTVGSVLP